MTAMKNFEHMASQTYEAQNVFAKILRKEIACRVVKETPHTLAFHDAFPRAPIHVLIIPKGLYTCAQAFYSQATPEEILDFSKMLGDLPKLLACEKDGFRLISNQGIHAGQEVPHFHMHLLGGKMLGGMV